MTTNDDDDDDIDHTSYYIFIYKGIPTYYRYTYIIA